MKSAFIVCLSLFSISLLAAGSERLSAQFYPEAHLIIDIEWAEPLHNPRDRQREHLLTATTRLTELRLNIPPAYLGSDHKIFLVIPDQFPGIRDHGVEIHWETRGRFNPGSAKPGDRILLYDGPISDSVLADQITFTFTMDARYVYGPMEFQPVYEIE